MKKVIFILSIIIITSGCKPGKINQVKEDNKDFASLLNKYKVSLSTFDREKLNENDKISFDILKWETDMGLGGLENHHVGSSDLIDNTYIPFNQFRGCLLYTSPSPRDRQKSRMPSSA